MATTADTKMIALDQMLEIVVVTAVWIPPTSLVIRDWSSPVGVDV